MFWEEKQDLSSIGLEEGIKSKTSASENLKLKKNNFKRKILDKQNKIGMQFSWTKTKNTEKLFIKTLLKNNKIIF